jgi:hypothetical protein
VAGECLTGWFLFSGGSMLPGGGRLHTVLEFATFRPSAPGFFFIAYHPVISFKYLYSAIYFWQEKLYDSGIERRLSWLINLITRCDGFSFLGGTR